MSRFVESRVRTKRLRCSMCNTKINKGDDVIFELDECGKFLAVYGETCKCKDYYEMDEINDTEHPFSSDALGQE